MVNTADKLSKEFSESEILIEEFRQKVATSLNKERERFNDAAEKEAKSILNKAKQDCAKITSDAEEESKQIINSAAEQAEKDADILIAQAQIKAEQIIKNAEESNHKDAREKTNQEVDFIISAARQEAKTISAKTLQQSKVEAKKILESAKNESILNAKQLRTSAEKESRDLILAASEMKQKASTALIDGYKKAEESANLIVEKEVKSIKGHAEKVAQDILGNQRILTQKEKDFNIEVATVEAKRSAENESTRILIAARQEAGKMITTGKEHLRVQIEESSRLISELQQQLLKGIVAEESTNQVTKQETDKPSLNEEGTSKPDKYCLLDNYT